LTGLHGFDICILFLSDEADMTNETDPPTSPRVAGRGVGGEGSNRFPGNDMHGLKQQIPMETRDYRSKNTD